MGANTGIIPKPQNISVFSLCFESFPFGFLRFNTTFFVEQQSGPEVVLAAGIRDPRTDSTNSARLRENNRRPGEWKLVVPSVFPFRFLSSFRSPSTFVPFENRASRERRKLPWQLYREVGLFTPTNRHHLVHLVGVARLLFVADERNRNGGRAANCYFSHDPGESGAAWGGIGNARFTMAGFSNSFETICHPRSFGRLIVTKVFQSTSDGTHVLQGCRSNRQIFSCVGIWRLLRFVLWIVISLWTADRNLFRLVVIIILGNNNNVQLKIII